MRAPARTVVFVLVASLVAACGGGGDSENASAGKKPTTTVGAGVTDSSVADGAAPAEAAGGPATTAAKKAAAKKKASTAAARATPNSTVPVADLGPRAASENRTGVTKDRIRLGYHWPKGGPYGPLLRTYHDHFRLYFEGKGGLNERGGVGGRKVELVEADDKQTPAGASAAAKELEDKQVFTVFGHTGVEQQLAMLSHFEQKRIPYIANGLMTPHVQSSAMGFTFLTPWDLVARSSPSFIANVLKLKGKKLGVIWETPDWPIPKDAFLDAAKAEGLTISIVEQVGATQASYVANVDKVRASGAVGVVLVGRLSVPGILRDARAIGYQPTWTGFGPWTLNLFNTVSGGLMEGIKAVRQWQGVDSGKYAEYKAFLEANGKGGDATEDGYGGWMIGFFYEHVLARAGLDPTREALIQGLEATGGNPIQLTVTPPVRYAAGRHWQSDEALPVEVKNRNWLKIGNFASRF